MIPTVKNKGVWAHSIHLWWERQYSIVVRDLGTDHVSFEVNYLLELRKDPWTARAKGAHCGWAPASVISQSSLFNTSATAILPRLLYEHIPMCYVFRTHTLRLGCLGPHDPNTQFVPGSSACPTLDPLGKAL